MTEPEIIIVELEPYRERRRTRTLAAGIILGLLWAAYAAPILADLVRDLLDVADAALSPVESGGDE